MVPYTIDLLDFTYAIFDFSECDLVV
jgi:hypothetical protein